MFKTAVGSSVKPKMIGVHKVIEIARRKRIDRQLQVERLSTALSELLALAEKAPEEWTDAEYARFPELNAIVRSN